MKACSRPILPITSTVSQNRLSLIQLVASQHRPQGLTKCIPQDLHAVLGPYAADKLHLHAPHTQIRQAYSNTCYSCAFAQGVDHFMQLEQVLITTRNLRVKMKQPHSRYVYWHLSRTWETDTQQFSTNLESPNQPREFSCIHHQNLGILGAENQLNSEC